MQCQNLAIKDTNVIEILMNFLIIPENPDHDDGLVLAKCVSSLGSIIRDNTTAFNQFINKQGIQLLSKLLELQHDNLQITRKVLFLLRQLVVQNISLKNGLLTTINHNDKNNNNNNNNNSNKGTNQNQRKSYN